MARDQSPDDVRKEHLDRLGSEVGPVYHALYEDWAWLQVKWQEYIALFGTNERRIEIMNSAAPLSFRVMQDALWENILIHLTRLTDPPESRGKANLTILRLREVLSDAGGIVEIAGKVDAALAVTEFARDWRNRRLAHHDLAVALDSAEHQLPGVSHQKIRDALGAIHGVLECVNHYALDSSLANQVFTVGDGGAASLLHILQDGLDARAAKMERIRTGTFTPDDIKPQREI